MSLADIVRFHKELKRRKSQYNRILDLFKKNGSVTNLELARVSFRYSARIGEIRKDYKIPPPTYLEPGVYLYTFKGPR